MTTRDPTAWMWAEAFRLIDRAERAHRHVLAEQRRAQPAWAPPVDIYEDDHHIEVVVALPGVGYGQVNVLLQGATLLVSAERPMPLARRGQALRVRRLEIPYGRFERQITLSGARVRLNGYRVVDGCLVVSLEKQQDLI